MAQKKSKIQRAFRSDGRAAGQSKGDHKKAMKWAEIQRMVLERKRDAKP